MFAYIEFIIIISISRSLLLFQVAMIQRSAVLRYAFNSSY